MFSQPQAFRREGHVKGDCGGGDGEDADHHLALDHADQDGPDHDADGDRRTPAFQQADIHRVFP